jgi:hypothetical protein
MRSLPDLVRQPGSAYILELKLLQEMRRFRSLLRLRQPKADRKRDCFKHEIIAFHSSEAC